MKRVEGYAGESLGQKKGVIGLRAEKNSSGPGEGARRVVMAVKHLVESYEPIEDEVFVVYNQKKKKKMKSY